MTGIVYTETVVHSAPVAFVKDAPYQLAIVVMPDGSRVTGRVEGEPVAIDDVVELLELRSGIPFFRKTLPK